MVTQLIEIDLCAFCVLAVSDGPPSSGDQQNETAPFKQEATVPSRLTLGARCGYNQRCWGSPVRQKKKHTGKLNNVTDLTLSENQPHLYPHDQTGSAVSFSLVVSLKQLHIKNAPTTHTVIVM